MLPGTLVGVENVMLRVLVKSASDAATEPSPTWVELQKIALQSGQDHAVTPTLPARAGY